MSTDGLLFCSQIGTVLCSMPGDGLFPAVGLHSEGEEVKINLDAEWEHKDVILMSIDNCEEEWSRLHDVRINGMVRALSRPVYTYHQSPLVQYKNEFNVAPWCCLHVMLKRSKVPLTKTVRLMVRVNKPLAYFKIIC